MGCGPHFGGKARWEGFCVGVGLVATLCGTELCAGKRAWLPHSSLQPSPPRFPSCVLISLVQRSLTLVFSQPCTPKRFQCAFMQRVYSQCVTSISCRPRYAGYCTNLLCFKVLYVTVHHGPSIRHSLTSRHSLTIRLVLTRLASPIALPLLYSIIPALLSGLTVRPRNMLIPNILPKCPAFRAMQDIRLTGCGSCFYASP